MSRAASTFALQSADAVQWLQSLPDASVDLVITDPPYESLEKYRAIGTTTRLSHSKASSNDWFKIFWMLQLFSGQNEPEESCSNP